MTDTERIEELERKSREAVIVMHQQLAEITMLRTLIMLMASGQVDAPKLKERFLSATSFYVAQDLSHGNAPGPRKALETAAEAYRSLLTTATASPNEGG